MNIPIVKVSFGAKEIAAVHGPLKSGWVVQGPYVAKFEKAFNQYTQAPASIATSSCTTALHVAVAALGLKPGQEVIVPAFTWIATANVVEYMGAKPVFCDIDLRTFNIDVKKIEACITRKTVGIIPVHLFGLCADMNAVKKIAKRHKLWVVEDAACAFGSRYYGRHAGLLGDAGCFSFHPRKSLTTGEGGMIITRNSKLEKKCRSLRDHGMAQTGRKIGFLLPDYDVLGYNFRMTDIQGALGWGQMKRAKNILKARTQAARFYDSLLKKISWLKTPEVPKGSLHSYQAYVCLFSPQKPDMKNTARFHTLRNLLMAELERKGIATRQGTHAVTLQTFYKKKYSINPARFPNALMADRLTLALPIYPGLTKNEQRIVAAELQKAFRKVCHD